MELLLVNLNILILNIDAINFPEGLFWLFCAVLCCQ